jgi:hypothetical protein
MAGVLACTSIAVALPSGAAAGSAGGADPATAVAAKRCPAGYKPTRVIQNGKRRVVCKKIRRRTRP